MEVSYKKAVGARPELARAVTQRVQYSYRVL